MARRRVSMREGPLAELFKATEAAQRQSGREEPARKSEPVEDLPTAEHAGPEASAPEPVEAPPQATPGEAPSRLWRPSRRRPRARRGITTGSSHP